MKRLIYAIALLAMIAPAYADGPMQLHGALTPNDCVNAFSLNTAQDAGGPCNTISEGTWTPTLGGGTVFGVQTYTRQIGRWVKSGDFVYIAGRVTISAKDAGISGVVIIGNLPFTPQAIANMFGPISVSDVSNVTLDTGFTMFGLRVSNSAGTNTMVLTEIGSNNSSAGENVTNLGATADIIFAGTYYVGQ